MNALRQELFVVEDLHRLLLVDPVGTLPLPDVINTRVIIERLDKWRDAFEKGQATTTIKAVQCDWSQYFNWCVSKSISALPASCDQLGDFLIDGVAAGKKRNTLKRYIYTVVLVHKAAGLVSPTEDPRWKPKWAAIGKALASRVDEHGEINNGNSVKQAGELLAVDIQTIVQTLGDTPRDLRDAAM